MYHCRRGLVARRGLATWQVSAMHEALGYKCDTTRHTTVLRVYQPKRVKFPPLHISRLCEARRRANSRIT